MEEKLIKEHKETLKEVMQQIASVSRFIKGVPADTPKQMQKLRLEMMAEFLDAQVEELGNLMRDFE